MTRLLPNMPHPTIRPTPAGREIGQVIRLAFADFRYEWRLSLCLVLALAAVLAPLLILFGLKFGLINKMTIPLLENPAYREIIPVGSDLYRAAWFAEMRGSPQVGFVLPRTRSLAATISLANPKARDEPPVRAELIPTGVGDPLLAGAKLPTIDDARSVVLSNRAAQKLGLEGGGRVEGLVSRTLDGRGERARILLDVIAVAPEAAFSRAGAFVHLDLLLAVEDYRDGFEVAEYGWAGRPKPDGPRTYSSYRLYAANLDSVAALRDALRLEDREVRTRATEIATMRSLGRNLGVIFWLIAGIGGTGYLLSLAASLWANVDRKRRELSILRLLGIRTSSLFWFPICHALFITLAGTITAIVVALLVETVLNRLFATTGAPEEVVCLLLPAHLFMSVVITVGFAVASSLLAARRSTSIEPAEELRHV